LLWIKPLKEEILEEHSSVECNPFPSSFLAFEGNC